MNKNLVSLREMANQIYKYKGFDIEDMGTSSNMGTEHYNFEKGRGWIIHGTSMITKQYFEGCVFQTLKKAKEEIDTFINRSFFNPTVPGRYKFIKNYKIVGVAMFNGKETTFLRDDGIDKTCTIQYVDDKHW